MADNVTADGGDGLGAVFATDDISSVHYPLTKIALGALDANDGPVSTANPMPVELTDSNQTVVADIGNIETNTDFGAVVGGGVEATALRVTLANDSTGVVSVDDGGGALTVDGTVTANLSATDNAVLDAIAASAAIMDDWDESDRAKVNLIAGQAGIAAGAGAVAATVPRVTLASDDPAVALLGTIDTDTGAIKTAVELIDNAISGTEMQVDVVAALPAGTNAIGKLAANSGVDIGDVDVTSISAGSNLIGDVGLSGARTSGGTTLYKNIDVDESEDQVKGSGGQIYWIHAINLKASALFLKIYNNVAASVTVGTTVPDLTFPIPTQGDTNGAGFTISIPNGIAFSTGITIACTTGVADNDSGAPGANECIVNLGFA